MRTLWMAAAVALCAGGAVAEPAVTIRNNGPVDNRINLVVLGDGYTSSEMVKYASDVDVFISGVFAQPPYADYAQYFNVVRVDVVSNQSGVDHPERGVARDTALGAFYNCIGIQRTVCIDITLVNAVVGRSVPANARDLILVIVNDSEYGGSGGTVAVASTNSSAIEIVTHEFGHSIGLLADEYSSSPPTCLNTVEPPEPNVAKDIGRTSNKWAVWIDPSTPLPTAGTALGVPGAYEGARYCSTGLYRPTYDSKMRSLGRPFDQINTEQLTRRFYNFVSPIDSAIPADAALTRTCGEPLDLLVQVPRPSDHQLSIKWRLDGTLIGTASSASIDTSRLLAGSHTIEVEVSDATAAVKRDPAQALIERHQWNLTLQGRSRATVLGFPSC